MTFFADKHVDNDCVMPQFTKKIIIGVVVPSLKSSGGVETVVEMLIKQIELSETYDYLLISLATSSSDDSSSRISKPFTFFSRPTTKKLEWRGRKLMHVGCSFAELEFMRYKKRSSLRNILKECDLIQVVGGFPAWGASVLDCGKPLSVWCATRCIWERGHLLGASRGLIGHWRRLMTKVTNHLDDFVIENCNSLMVMNHLMSDYAGAIKGIYGHSIVYAPPGVDTYWFSPILDRLPLGVREERPYILSVGRLGDSRKNPELLLKAYLLLIKKNPTFPRLTLAGDSAPSSEFWKKVTDFGLIEHVTFIEKPNNIQLRSLYQNALCFALSSDEEGFGMVLVEAMACGVPVVSTRCGGPDGIISYGVDGYLVEIGDAESLAEHLKILCSDLDVNQQMGLKAREKAVALFSEESMGKLFFDTWSKLLQPK